MFLRLLLLLTIVPIIELIVLLQVHHAITEIWGGGTGLLVTVGTIVGTGIAGAALARGQGLLTIQRLQQSLSRGEFPGTPIVDGVLILLGAALLLTPGFLTDILGFSLLIPVSRQFYRTRFRHWIDRQIQRGRVDIIEVSANENASASPNRAPREF
ncbi:MAG: FxsA family protein [Planctomycetaceae bacterium]|nr:FxsA family protein [Planctomycetaceae bacterium]